MDETEFKFPDEVDQNKPKNEEESTEIEIEIEDDTPAEDRNRKPMPKEIVEKLEKDELEAYDDDVKAKILQMRKVYHDERREKESALREQHEAVTLARRLMDENKKIRGVLQAGEKEYVQSIQNTASLQLEMAKKAYREAYESGDVDKQMDAQQAMQEANMRLMQAKNFKMPALQEQQNEVQTIPEQYQPAQVQDVPEPDPTAKAWQKRNPWFGTNKGMSAFALGLHEELRDNGVEVGSAEYYKALDKTLRKRFPEVFGEPVENQSITEGQAKRAPSVVAPAMRSTASNKVKLRTSQLNLAKKLGLTPEQYAIELKKLENQNG
jgi:hypothetical protein